MTPYETLLLKKSDIEEQIREFVKRLGEKRRMNLKDKDTIEGFAKRLVSVNKQIRGYPTGHTIIILYFKIMEQIPDKPSVSNFVNYELTYVGVNLEQAKELLESTYSSATITGYRQYISGIKIKIKPGTRNAKRE